MIACPSGAHYLVPQNCTIGRGETFTYFLDCDNVAHGSLIFEIGSQSSMAIRFTFQTMQPHTFLSFAESDPHHFNSRAKRIGLFYELYIMHPIIGIEGTALYVCN